MVVESDMPLISNFCPPQYQPDFWHDPQPVFLGSLSPPKWFSKCPIMNEKYPSDCQSANYANLEQQFFVV